MPLSAHILESFHTIVGDKGLITDPTHMVPYLTESRGRFNGHCSAIVKPATTQETAEVIATCHEEHIPVVPQGGNTGHVGGSVPDGGILLNLSRLNKIRQIDAMNATMTVEAGVILQDIQAAAKEVGMMFPLSLAAQGSCQIGGNLSTNAGGVHVLRYGNTRDLTLGLEAVLPDGQIWKGLRGLRKDNTGLDLKHLFIGAEGSLGIITAATLKLFPLPKQQTVAMISASSVAHLMDTFARLRDELDNALCAFEIMPRFGMEIVTTHMEGLNDPFDKPYPWYGLIEINLGKGLTLDLIEELLTDLLERDYIHDALIAQNGKQAQTFWALREAMSEAQKKEGGSIKQDISLPISRIADFMKEASNAIIKRIPGARMCTFGHVGDGNLHFNVTQPREMPLDRFLSYRDEINDLIHEMCETMGGSFSAEHGIGQVKLKEMELYRGGTELFIMRQIKRTLDPHNIMNPGKVIPL